MGYKNKKVEKKVGVKKKVVVIKIWGKKKSGGKTDWKKNGGVKKGGVKNCGHKKCDKISQKLISKIWTRPKTRSLRRPLKLEVPLKKWVHIKLEGQWTTLVIYINRCLKKMTVF